jgi:hypothetical protein
MSSSNLIEHVKNMSSLLYTIAYHYCEFGNQSTLEPQYIVRSLCRQVTEQLKTFPKAVPDAYHKLSRSSPSLNVLVYLLLKTAKACNLVFIIVDGIDECPDREPLLKALYNMQKLQCDTSHLNILVSSRPEHDLSTI